MGLDEMTWSGGGRHVVDVGWHVVCIARNYYRAASRRLEMAIGRSADSH